MEDKILEIIKEESENANVGKYTCINGFGYSQFERNIAERVVKLFCQPAVVCSFVMEFNGCTSLKTVTISSEVLSKCSRMVMLDEMTFNQIEWCKDKGIIENLKPEVAKQLNMCAFFALIPSDLINEFAAL